MGGYTNGRYPLSMMVHLGGQVYLPPGTAARWRWMVAQGKAKYGVTLYVTPGWNGYRPYDVQVQYRKDLGIWAAVAGYSSHGLIYRGRQVAAADVGNWQSLAPGNRSLAWSRFSALCRLAGFTVNFVSPEELWHIGDFNNIWAVPAFVATPIPVKPVPVPIPVPVPEPLMEEIMSFRSLAIGYRKNDDVDAIDSVALDWEDGAQLELKNTPKAYTESFSEALTEGGFKLLTAGHFAYVLEKFGEHQKTMRARELEIARAGATG